MEDLKAKKTPRISLRFKWTFFITIVVFFMYLVFSITVFYFVSNSIIKNEENTVKNALMAVSSRFKDEKKPLNKKSIKKEIYSLKNGNDTLLEQLRNSGLQVVILDNDKKILLRTDNTNIYLKEVSNFKIVKNKNNLRIDNLVGFSSIKNKNQIIGYVAVKNKMRTYHQTVNNLIDELLPNAIAALLLSIALGFILVEFVLRRLKLINQTIDSVKDYPESDARIPIQKQNDEITDLAEQFNEMLDKMQQYASQQKEFVQDVSHELRTPVAVVEGHLKLLNRWGKDDPEVLDESLKSSLQEINRMKHLIQEMLDLTRIEQPGNKFSNEVSDAKPLINQIYNDFKVLHPEFLINLDYDVREDAKVKIYRNHLEQIIIILLDNAIKYSREKKEVYIAVSRNENYLEIAIQDFGVGISPENQEKIFNRFYRADKDRSRQSGGNGLGLPIAKQLVKNYKGFMYVESIEGSGSVFRVELPLEIKKINS
ncbi:HAMP domain-containing sensor histidine kinase [Companilactobacillus sp. DQM5]|uniref:HAMP domain-containing sensor histidine kinase n=1 Tax=Companilactobacillus sp. DQM5 TaxID=3463359 RepID=UPI0040587151